MVDYDPKTYVPGIDTPKYDVEEIKKARKVLAEYTYEPSEIVKGYNSRSLYINVGTNEFKEKVVTEGMKENFIGGKGFDLYYLWNAVNDDTDPLGPDNEIVMSPGPLAGNTQYPGSGKTLVCSLSPLTNSVIDSNVGGFFGPYLKFSGFDALEIQGIADKEVVIFIDGNERKITIEEAPLDAIDSHVFAEQMFDMYGEDNDDKINVSTVSAGQAAELSPIGCLNFSFWDKRRSCARLKQAGRGGIGTVLRNKHIKGLVIRFRGTGPDMNHALNKKLLNEAGLRIHREMTMNDDFICEMRKIGTAHIVDVMDAYDLLPVMNYRYGMHPETKKVSAYVFGELYLLQNVPDGCWYGCSMSCAKACSEFTPKTGPYKGQRVCVDGPEYENAAGLGPNCGIFDPHWVMEANFYCDTYGICTISMGTMTAFAYEMFNRGFINLDDTEGLDMRWGNGWAQQELMHQMVAKDGFGCIEGRGIHEMKRIFAERFGQPAPEYEYMLQGREWNEHKLPERAPHKETSTYNPLLKESKVLADWEYNDREVLDSVYGTDLECTGADAEGPFLCHPKRWEKIEGIPTISHDEIADWPVGKPYYSYDPKCPYTNGRPWIKMTDKQVQDMFDAGMECKGLEYSEYGSKQSLAQQGGYAMTNKGPQHDEAWLIFMDMVNSQIPTFEDKAYALWYFPCIRTWFGLYGLCKLPWNDVEPIDNYRHKQANKVPAHIQNYFDIVKGITGKELDEDAMIHEIERIYTLQRVFVLRRGGKVGLGQRKDDTPPYRSMGPVTKEEYLSREEEYYKKDFIEKMGWTEEQVKNTPVEEKMAKLREYRYDQYNQLLDAVYKRRNWTKNGTVRLQKLIDMKMDYPDLVRIIRPYLKAEGEWPTGPEYAKYDDPALYPDTPTKFEA